MFVWLKNKNILYKYISKVQNLKRIFISFVVKKSHLSK